MEVTSGTEPVRNVFKGAEKNFDYLVCKLQKGQQQEGRLDCQNLLSIGRRGADEKWNPSLHQQIATSFNLGDLHPSHIVDNKFNVLSV